MSAMVLGMLCAMVSAKQHVSPADELRAVLADLETHVPRVDWRETRYLSLHNLPRERWAETHAVVSFVLNSVSRSDRIVRPTIVPDRGGGLLRFSLADYGLPAEAWELLASEDPYWHLRSEVLDPASGKRKQVFTDGGWVGLEAGEALRAKTRSAGALLRADFFVARVSTTLDGGHYYRFAGIPRTETEWFAALGIDLKTVSTLHADRGANMIRSDITQKVRRVVRRQGPLGGTWQTYDVARSTPERDPLRHPFAFEFDASEHIATKRNGLHLFSLNDRQGARQETVPDVVAKDTSDPHGPGIVAPMLSCVRCHVESGLRPIANDQRHLAERGVDLFAERTQDADRLAAFYGSTLEKELRRDREDYAEAVAAATGGCDAAEVASWLAEMYRDHRDALVTPARAARELGVPLEDLADVLGGSTDPVLLALQAGLSVQREQWVASFAEAALRAAGEKP
ncbi:MAG: hypothetical protein KF708_02615 [Pirellulales bacterium]|nr:hypothetical protein [Pirellulales bacterium]